MAGQDEAQHPVRYRAPLLQAFAVPALAGLTGCLAAAVAVRLHGGHLMGSEIRSALLGSLTMGLVSGLMSRRGSGTDLRPDAIVVRGFRTRHLRRSEIRLAVVQRRLGVRQILVWDVRGKGLFLPQPTSLFDRRFDEKCRQIMAWIGERQ